MTARQWPQTKLPAAPNDVFLGTQTIISASEQTREYPYYFAKHIHKSIEIYLINSGRCAMEINSRTFFFQTGDFVMIHPNTVHSFYMEKSQTCTFRHIHFDPSFFSRWYLEQSDPHVLSFFTALNIHCNSFFHLTADEKISALTDNILSEHADGGFLSAAMENLYMAELLLYLVKLTRSEPSFHAEEAIHSPEHIRYVSYALSYIHKNYAGKVLISDIAAHLNISARYLSKIFFLHMNLTILNYINIYRINQAIELMLNTDFTLTRISEQVGLKDSQHFSKLFRNIIGLPPSQYRKLLLHDIDEASSGEDSSVLYNSNK